MAQVNITIVAPGAFGNALGESIAGANGQGSRSAGGSDSLDAFLALNDNFSGVDVNGGVPMVNGRNFSQDAAARRAGLNPAGLPTYSESSASPAPDAAVSGGKGITQIVAELSQPRTYTAQSGDNISRILGTSDPQAVGNFMRANGLRSSTVYAGQDYVIPGAINGLGDNSALGQNALNVDNSRLKAMADARAAQVATYRNENYGNEGRQSLQARADDIAFVANMFGKSPALPAAVAPPAQWSVAEQSSPVALGTTIEQVQYAASASNPNTQLVGFVRANPGDPSILQQAYNSPEVQGSMNGPFGTLVKAAVGTFGDSYAGYSGYNPVANQFYGPLEQQSAMWRTVATAGSVVVPEAVGALRQAAPAELAGAGRVASYSGDIYAAEFVGPVKREYFYRGDSTQRSSFMSSMAQERGAQVSTEFLSSRSGSQLADIFDAHGNIGSQGLPTIGASKDPVVAEYFARGPFQNQNGFVTTFRIESREAENMAFRNIENRRDVFDINSNIGRPEQEYLFQSQIDSKYIYQQRQLGLR